MNYCIKCGRQLMDGEVCNCENQSNLNYDQYNNGPFQQDNIGNYNTGNQYNNSYQQNNYQNMNKSGAGIQNAMYTILDLVKHPVQEGVEFVYSESNTITAVIMILIQAILSGFFALVICIKIQGIFDKVISAMSLASSSSTSKLIQIKSLLKMPMVKAFFLTLLISVLLTVILSLLFMLGNMIVKNQMNFIQSLKLVSVRSILVSMIVLVSCVIGLINIYAGIALFCMGNTIGFIVTAVLWSHCCDDTSDKQIYIMIVMVAIFTIVYAVIANLCWTQYLPDALKLALDTLKSTTKGLGSIDDIIQQIITSM